MRETNKRKKGSTWIGTGILFIVFVLWTIAIQCVDVQRIGPENSAVGFATVNEWFHKLMGVHLFIYTLTDWLGLVPLLAVVGFGLCGMMQLLKRKSLYQVDANLLVLGGFYIVVMAAYILFEIFPVNYRPVLIEGELEASYPSSTTLLVMCVMPTAALQLRTYIRKNKLCSFLQIMIILFTGFMVIGRLISGVHWLTDIVGGMILSMALCMLYLSVIKQICFRKGSVCKQEI